MFDVADIRSGLNEELEREKQKRLQVEAKCKDCELSEATLRRTIADIEAQILYLDSAKVSSVNTVIEKLMNLKSWLANLKRRDTICVVPESNVFAVPWYIY